VAPPRLQPVGRARGGGAIDGVAIEEGRHAKDLKRKKKLVEASDNASVRPVTH
jgi:hypothetical protein